MTPSEGSVRLLAIDLDGTLLDSHQKISNRNVRALTRAHKDGIHVAIVTGRRNSATRLLTSALDFPHFQITSAGALISSTTQGTMMASFWKPERLQRFLTHVVLFRARTFLIAQAEGPGEILCENPDRQDPHVDRYIRLNGDFIVRSQCLANPVPRNVLQVAFLGGLDRMETLRNRVSEFPDLDSVSVAQTRYPERDFELVDVVEAGSDKGHALGWLAKTLDIESSDVMAIGDNLADQSMLQYAGHPVVMANGHETLKALWPVTGTNDADGVATAVEKYCLQHS